MIPSVRYSADISPKSGEKEELFFDPLGPLKDEKNGSKPETCITNHICFVTSNFC